MLPVCLSVCSGQEHSPLQTPAALVCPSRGFLVLRGQLCSLPGGRVSCLARCWSVFYHRCDVSSPFVRREDTFFIVPQRLWQESGGTGDWRIWTSCCWTRRDEASTPVRVLACWGQMLRPSDVHVGATWDRSLSSVSTKHAGGTHTHTRHRAIHTHLPADWPWLCNGHTGMRSLISRFCPRLQSSSSNVPQVQAEAAQQWR